MAASLLPPSQWIPAGKADKSFPSITAVDDLSLQPNQDHSSEFLA